MHLPFTDLHKSTLRHKIVLKSLLATLVILCFLILACSSSVPYGEEIPASQIDMNNYSFLPYDAQKLKALIEEDVESFYDIPSKYHTDIELKFFRKSDEPRRLRDKMRNKLASLLKKTYVMEIGKIDLYSYDLKKKAFDIDSSDIYMRIGGEMGSPKAESRMLRGFWFENLPFVFQEYCATLMECTHSRHLYLGVNEEIAMKLGKSKNTAYLVFNIMNSLENGFVRTKHVGIVVVDKSSWETLYAVKYSNFDENKVWKKK